MLPSLENLSEHDARLADGLRSVSDVSVNLVSRFSLPDFSLVSLDTPSTGLEDEAWILGDLLLGMAPRLTLATLSTSGVSAVLCSVNKLSNPKEKYFRI